MKKRHITVPTRIPHQSVSLQSEDEPQCRQEEEQRGTRRRLGEEEERGRGFSSHGTQTVQLVMFSGLAVKLPEMST